MKSKKYIITGVILAVLLVAVLIIYFSFKNTNTSEEPNNVDTLNVTKDLELRGEKYTPSQIYDEQNNQVDLSEFSDKPMALLFFNTTELKSTNVIEIFQKNYENYKDKVNFINVCIIDGVTETKEDVKNFIESKSVTIPVLYDTDYSAKVAYNIDTIPSIVFINKNNEVINTISDEIDEDIIQANLDIISENY